MGSVTKHVTADSSVASDTVTSLLNVDDFLVLHELKCETGLHTELGF